MSLSRLYGSSKTYFVKVLDIEEKEYQPRSGDPDKNPQPSVYKKVEVYEEEGWWIKHFYINVFIWDHLYRDIKVGDKLFLRVS